MKENICTSRVNRERERLKEYVIQEMLDKKRNMHGEEIVRRYVVCWEMVLE